MQQSLPRIIFGLEFKHCGNLGYVYQIDDMQHIRVAHVPGMVFGQWEAWFKIPTNDCYGIVYVDSHICSTPEKAVIDAYERFLHNDKISEEIRQQIRQKIRIIDDLCVIKDILE